MLKGCTILKLNVTDHRFVKTTPKPRATKNSRGELGPPLPVPGVCVGEGDVVVVPVGIDDSDDSVLVMFATAFLPVPVQYYG